MGLEIGRDAVDSDGEPTTQTTTQASIVDHGPGSRHALANRVDSAPPIDQRTLAQRTKFGEARHRQTAIDPPGLI